MKTPQKPARLIALDILTPQDLEAYKKLDYGYKLVLSRALYAYGQDVGEFARAAVGIEKTEFGVRVYRFDGKEYDNPVIAQKLAQAAADNPQYKLKAIACELVPEIENNGVEAAQDEGQIGAILEGDGIAEAAAEEGNASEAAVEYEAPAAPKKSKTSKKK